METHRKSVFISYSHKDKTVVDELKTCLAPWVRERRLSVWDDSQISPGESWAEEIERAILKASIAVLVVSADFLASDYVVEKELPLIIQRARANQIRIFLFITDSVDSLSWG